MEKSAGKAPSEASSRYRTNRLLAHHQLAKELSEELEVKEARSKQLEASKDEENESEDDFVAQKRAPAKRERFAPQVLSRTKEEPKVVQRKRRAYDSSSSDSDSGKRRQNCRRQDSDDSSSSDEEDDHRRQRLLARRKREEPEVIVPKSKDDVSEKKVKSQTNEESKNKSAVPKARKEPIQKAKPKRQESSSESSSGSGDSSSGSRSDESSSDSSSEEEQVMAKPVFVPKHKRNLVQPEEKKWEEEEARHQREKEREEKRKMESRAMVAKQLAAVETSTNDEDVDEEIGGATNSPPNDDDDVDREQARDAWELRELARLLLAMDQQKEREMEQLEYQRRRQMTDEECLREDTNAGRYQAPGSTRQGQPKGKFMQRFFHRGAFYMDEEEWDESDVRHKSAEYAREATGEDKIDKSQLPEVMQVKNFGFARQNTRYKGLANEDTTDKGETTVPLVRKKKVEKESS
jgi:microfibrillar-associated protein 1